MVSVDRIKGLSSALAIKTPVLAATTAPVTLSGLQTIDGVSIPSGGRVLVKDQVDTAENGWYDASTSAWQRSLDANASNDLTPGTLCSAAHGTLNGGYIFQLVTATAAALPGTTGMTFTRVLANTTTTSTFIEQLLAADDAAEALTTLGVSAFIQTLLGDADAATARETLGLSIGDDVQAYVAPGTAGNVLMSNGEAWVSASGVQRMMLVPATSAAGKTSVDFSDIPSWAKEISVLFYNVSTNGTSVKQIQIGSGTIAPTGYSGSGVFMADSAAVGSGNSTTGYQIRSGSAADTLHGGIDISTMGGNVWIAKGNLGNANAGSGFNVGGGKTLAGALDLVRVTTANGTDLFDAGSIGLLIKGFA